MTQSADALAMDQKDALLGSNELLQLLWVPQLPSSASGAAMAHVPSQALQSEQGW